MSRYQVIVGNIGTVLDTDSRQAAAKTYGEYKQQSIDHYGRASGEEVTLFMDDEPLWTHVPKIKLPLIKDIRTLLVSLKRDIGDEYRASGDRDDSTPGMQVTIGADDTGAWSYQTGDNSYTGGAYGMPYWGVISLYRCSNSTDLARDVIDQIAELQWS